MAYDPDQPRDNSGRWAAVGHAIAALVALAAAGAKALGLAGYKRTSPSSAASAKLYSESLGTRTLSSHEVSSIGHYVNGSMRINRPLREGTSSRAELVTGGGRTRQPLSTVIGGIDSALSKSSLPTGHVFYRGVSKTAFGSQPIKAGSIITDRGYVSTSLDRKVANEYAQSPADGSGAGHVMHIYAKRGSKALAIGPVHPLADEFHEVLLPRNSRYRVLSVHGNDVHAELL